MNDSLDSKSNIRLKKHYKLVLKRPKNPLDLLLALFCAIAIFLCEYSISGAWTATESISYPFSNLEPRDSILFQLLWISGSLFGFFISFLLSPLFRCNCGGFREWLKAVGVMGLSALVLTLPIYFVFILTMGGLDGLLGPESYHSSIVIGILGLYLMFAIIISGLFYFAEAIEEHPSDDTGFFVFTGAREDDLN